jgi:hypothetical protein
LGLSNVGVFVAAVVCLFLRLLGLVGHVQRKNVLKNNTGFFWVATVVLPAAFFFAFDRGFCGV